LFVVVVVVIVLQFPPFPSLWIQHPVGSFGLAPLHPGQMDIISYCAGKKRQALIVSLTLVLFPIRAVDLVSDCLILWQTAVDLFSYYNIKEEKGGQPSTASLMKSIEYKNHNNNNKSIYSDGVSRKISKSACLDLSHQMLSTL
jgi:hypothetical protein